MRSQHLEMLCSLLGVGFSKIAVNLPLQQLPGLAARCVRGNQYFVGSDGPNSVPDDFPTPPALVRSTFTYSDLGSFPLNWVPLG